MWKCLRKYACAYEHKWSRTHTFHCYDQISFVCFLPPCSAPSAFQNSLTPSSALGFPAQTPTFLLPLDHTLKVKHTVWHSIQTSLSIYKYAILHVWSCKSMRFSEFDNHYRRHCNGIQYFKIWFGFTCLVTDNIWKLSLCFLLKLTKHKAYDDYWMGSRINWK